MDLFLRDLSSVFLSVTPVALKFCFSVWGFQPRIVNVSLISIVTSFNTPVAPYPLSLKPRCILPCINTWRVSFVLMWPPETCRVVHVSCEHFVWNTDKSFVRVFEEERYAS